MFNELSKRRRLCLPVRTIIPPPLLCLTHLQPYLRCFSAELGHFPWIGTHRRYYHFIWRKMHHLLGFRSNAVDCTAHRTRVRTHIYHVWYDPPICSIKWILFWKVSWINIAHYPKNISPELYIHWSVTPITSQWFFVESCWKCITFIHCWFVQYWSVWIWIGELKSGEGFLQYPLRIFFCFQQRRILCTLFFE